MSAPAIEKAQADPLDGFGAIPRLAKDVRAAAARLSELEARYLVDMYYQQQKDRQRVQNQEFAADAQGDPGMVLTWLLGQRAALESRAASLLDAYSAGHQLGMWARSNMGVGPIMAAGLLAYVDVTVPTAGHIWSFAGLDPRCWHGDATKAAARISETVGAGKVDLDGLRKLCIELHRPFATMRRTLETDRDGNVAHAPPWTRTAVAKAFARRPHCGALKRLCWLVGESFVKVQNHPEAYYGRLYQEARADEDARNERGELAEQAAHALATKNYGKDTEAWKAYSQGRLPKAHLYARAKRRVVKLFLSHYHQVGHTIATGKAPARPWAIEHGGHSHYIPPPNWDG